MRGGSRSGKSFALIQVLVIWIYTGQIQGRKERRGVFTVARSTLPALKATILKEFINYLHELDIYKYIEHGKSSNIFRYNGREIAFISTDDEHKLRGRESTFFWLNECNDTPKEVFDQIIIRCKKSVYLDYNPSGRPWVRTEIEDKRLKERGDVFLDVSTYKDNPFLNAELRQEIAALRLSDKSLYEIYTLGRWTELKGLIYPKFTIIDQMPFIQNRVFYGVDFGYIDPAVFVKIVINERHLYIDCLVYERGLLIDELAAKILEHQPESAVFCDPSSPQLRAELKKHGVNARPGKTGKDARRQGINFIKQHSICITAASVHSIDEFRRYKWREVDGQLIEEPISNYDHTSDAARYALTRALGAKMRII